MSESPWRLVALDGRHSAEIRALFEQVFAQPMSEALWRWKYADGRGLATGARDRHGRLLAHYGGTGRTLWIQGRRIGAVQLGDVMVAPDARGFLSRNGPFGVATQGFLQQHIGPGRAFSLGFGFPGARHVRLGQKLGLYDAIGEVQEVTWPAAAQPAFALAWRRYMRGRLTPMDWNAADTQGELDALWHTMLVQGGRWMLGERDGHWWRHRFANHPQGHYRCWWLRDRLSGRAVAALALRPSSESSQPWELLDWVAAPRHAGAVVQAARDLAAREDRALLGWFSTTVMQVLAAAGSLTDARMAPACMACVTRSHDATMPAPASLPWWLTGGDTDFR